MKLFAKVLVGALFAQQAVASWLGNQIYNKWHQTELERWLNDHDVPYPQPADRKDLENLVKDNWNRYVITPYEEWDTKQMRDYLNQKGVEVKEKNEEDREWLKGQLQKKWYETESAAEEGYGNVKDWAFDTWTESQLKSFLDYNKIPSPEPRNRDTLLATVRGNYATMAEKANQVAAYPGDWIYSQWSDSDLKSWLDTNGFPAPQPKNRDKLIASVRRNSRQATLRWEDAKKNVGDTIFDTWSDSQLKEFLDKNGVPVPQNGKKDELLALARENKAKLTGDTFAASVTSYYGAATSSANNWIAQATQAAIDTGSKIADTALETWSETRLKAFLDARGVAVPQNGKKDEILALARRYKYLAATKQGYWTFENWTVDDLRAWFKARGIETAEYASATRDELASNAASAYNTASDSGEAAFSTISSALAQATDSVRRGTFNTWSESELKKYLDHYGVKTYQGSSRNELIAKARYWQQIMQSGWQPESAISRFQRQVENAYHQLMASLGIAKAEVDEKVSEAAAKAKKASENIKAEL